MNRGGSWNNDSSNCRAANRNVNAPSNRNNNLGLRLARAPPEQRRLADGTDRSSRSAFWADEIHRCCPVLVAKAKAPGGFAVYHSSPMSKVEDRNRQTHQPQLRWPQWILTWAMAPGETAVAERLPSYPGYRLSWSGQYEFMERVRERLKIFVPLTLGIIFLLYFFTFRSVTETLIVMLSVPVALLGGIWSLYLLDYNMSIAVWVGLIALAGIAAETTSIMIVYLDQAYQSRLRAGHMNTMQDLCAAVLEGSAGRLRPMMMTVGANIFGLMPVMWASGAGADTMKRIAAPLIGGLLSAILLTLVILPALYTIWKGFEVRRRGQQLMSDSKI